MLDGAGRRGGGQAVADLSLYSGTVHIRWEQQLPELKGWRSALPRVMGNHLFPILTDSYS